MKKFGLFLMSALALVALASCNDDEDNVTPNEEQGDAYWAAQATVTSSDSNFTANSNGGTINFKAEGGSVTLYVDCGCDWLVDNSVADLFPTSYTSTSVTVTADQNTIEEELTGTFTLKTANDGITFATIDIVQNAYGAPEITIETNEWHAPAVGALTTEIAVEASADWTAESADAWLTVTKTDTGISLTADENGETTERETKVTLICTDGINSDSETITVIQDALAYITLSDESLTLFGNASSNTITVESNFDDWSCESDEWITITRNGDAMTVSVEDNDGESRNGTVTVTAGDGAENVAEAQLTITQGSIADMILTYNITSANTTTNLPLYEYGGVSVNCTVDWGDGTVETVTSTQPSHTYVNAGEYDIIVNGTVPQLSSVEISSTNDPLPITAVKQWGKTGLVRTTYAFQNCSHLKSLPEYTGDALDDVTDVTSMFDGCSALEEIPADLFADCTEVTKFDYTFYYCTSLTSIPSSLFSNNKNATSFYGTFEGDTALTGESPYDLIDGVKVHLYERENYTDIYATIAVTGKGRCFRDCTGLSDYYSIPSGWGGGK